MDSKHSSELKQALESTPISIKNVYLAKIIFKKWTGIPFVMSSYSSFM